MTVFFVAGIPRPQGSKTAGLTKQGHAFVRDKSPRALKAWRGEVARTAGATWSYMDRIEGPVRVHAVFVFEKPKTVTRGWPSVRPDLDKLARALMDGITDAGCVWRDDAQVVEIDTSKVYGTTPGVHVAITQVTDAPDQPEGN